MTSKNWPAIFRHHGGTLTHAATSLVLVLLFALHAVEAPRLGWLDRLENLSYDLRLRATLPGGVDDRIVIADIDEESLEQLGRWPWPRDLLADMVDTLFEHYQIRLLAFDVVFAEPDSDATLKALDQLAADDLRDNQQFQRRYRDIRPALDRDQRLADSIRDRPVVMGFVFDQGSARRVNALPLPLATLPEEQQSVLPLRRPRGFTGNLEVLQAATGYGGFFDNPNVDPDGVYRRVPLVQEFDGQLYESLSLATARLALGEPQFMMRLEGDGQYRFIDEFRLGEQRIPLERQAAALVPYRGTQNSFPYVSIARILDRSVDPAILENRIVLVGTTAPGLLDLRTTPVQNIYPGVEVHANLVAGIMDGTIKHHPGWIIGLEFTLALLLGLIVTLLSIRLAPALATLSVVAVTAAYIGLNLYSWQAGLVLPLAAPVALITLLFMLHTTVRLFGETKDRLVLARLFGQYVPPELVKEIAARPDQISLAGENRQMTVLFSDVRGFTSISEGLDPEALTQLMNELLTPMTHVIHRNRGTIDKYMGDAIMAFWGAPLHDPEHARHALQAAMEIVDGLTEINEKFRARRWPEINVGVGLNTGQMSVGNMGSEFRMAYTVLGDAVNLGSRLEGLTKAYGVNIIVSESTRDQVPEFAYRELDLVRVKGKEEPVAIFEPIGPAADIDDATRQNLERYQQALAHYRSCEWDKADALFLALRAGEPRRKIYSIYLDRIGAFRSNPPPPDWDGVFTHTSK